MKKYNSLIKGTFILTLAGLLSRIIGFFYRIFLSHTIGAEGVGIYQMVFPVFAISFSITSAGIQTAVSKYVAAKHSKRSSYFLAGLTLSVFLSAICGSILYLYSENIAKFILLEPRCAPLIRLMSLSIPFESIHCCVNGYFLGLKKTIVPSITQLIEQSIRVTSVFAIYYYLLSRGFQPLLSVAVIGIVIGEFFAMIYSILAIYLHFIKEKCLLSFQTSHCTDILKMSIPLTGNRLVITLLASMEAIYIPNRLLFHGLTTSESLSIYGVLTGMALPLILFPSALTNSVAVLLLPIISEADAKNQQIIIKKAVSKTIRYCVLLGLFCNVFFLLIGDYAGVILFKNEMAGTFIKTLSFVCPLLFLNTPLTSILHGLGKTFTSFCFNIVGLGIRLLFVFFAIPLYGIKGYLLGLIISQSICLVLTLLAINHYVD